MDIDKNLINPVGKRILVKIGEKNSETKAGILLADTSSNSAPVMGEILKVGDKSVFAEGQLCFFRKYSLDELRFPNEDGEEDVVYFIEDDDVLGIIQKVDLEVPDKHRQITLKHASRKEEGGSEEAGQESRSEEGSKEGRETR